MGLRAASIYMLALLPGLSGINSARDFTIKERGKPVQITIEFNKDNPLNSFIPDASIGGGIDGSEENDIRAMLSPANVKAMREAGLQSMSYRLRTELGIEAWHWNSSGRWSDEKNQRGYWISDSSSQQPIDLSWGYKLPRRGSTFDQAENDGYSRIDDGDQNSFWKSNPYLDSRFTGAPDSAHEQWVAIDLGKKQKVNHLEIDWADPYAVDLRLEYAGEEGVSMFNDIDELDPYRDSMWKPLPVSVIHMQHGGNCVIQFSTRPIALRVIRLVCSRSSHTAVPGSTDRRDSCGYAIREIRIGLKDEHGFTDFVRHGTTNRSQSAAFASTTDPWHRPQDKDVNTEQPGIDFVFRSGLTGLQPALFCAGLVYDVPENTMALASYLRHKKYPLAGFELGEEPDGQYISPGDFTELYLQSATPLENENPLLKVGGPSFEGLDNDDEIKSWPAKFITCLKERSAMQHLAFLSFEWYPLDHVCDPLPPQLLRQPYTFKTAMQHLFASGLPEKFPVYITESGYSVLGAEPELRMEGALVNADVTACFFALGGSKIYMYGWEPGNLMKEAGDCGGYGNLEFFGLSKDSISFKTGLFYSAWLCTQKWAQPGDRELKIYKADCDLLNRLGYEVISAYPLYRPDGKWSVMLINKDDKNAHAISLNIKNTITGTVAPFSLDADMYQFSEKQYKWKAAGENGHPLREEWPEQKALSGKEETVNLPAYSITVLVQR